MWAPQHHGDLPPTGTPGGSRRQLWMDLSSSRLSLKVQIAGSQVGFWAPWEDIIWINESKAVS